MWNSLSDHWPGKLNNFLLKFSFPWRPHKLDETKALETCIISLIMDVKKTLFTCFEKMTLIKQQLPFSCTGQQYKFLERFHAFIKNLSDDYFTKITSATWSIHNSIPVTIALDETSHSFLHHLFYSQFLITVIHETLYFLKVMLLSTG